MIIDNQLVLGLYAIKDLKNGFLTPTPESNDDSAIRNFAHACQNTQSLFFTHPQDYELFKIANFYPETGLVEPVEKVYLRSALDFIKKEGA